MSYELAAIIGRRGDIGALEALVPDAPPVELHQGLVLVPTPPERGGDPGGAVAPFRWLTDSLLEALAAAATPGGVAYVEADFFGGDGDQVAAVWFPGRVAFGPETTADSDQRQPLRDLPINRALRVLGASAGADGDEFAAVGLDRFRSTDDWLRLPPLLRSLPAAAVAWKVVPGRRDVHSARVEGTWLRLSAEDGGYIVRVHRDPALRLPELPSCWTLERG